MRTIPISASVCLLFVVACGSRSPDVDAHVSLLLPAAVDDHVVFVDSGRAEARLLDVSGDAPPSAPGVVSIVRNATLTQSRNGHTDQLLVLCAGQADVKGATPERPGLVVLHADGTSKEYRYDSPFDHIVQSDDGRYVFLFFGPTNGDTTMLRNPNEVAIIDLDQENGKPTLKTLRSLGQSPQGVVFSPGPMAIGGTDRSLAVIFLDRDVAVMDLSHLERSEFTIELTKPTASPLNVNQVVFSAGEKPPKIYLRADGSNDVFVMSIQDASPSSGADGGAPSGENDFFPSFNQVGAGSSPPSDIQVFNDGAETRLLVASRGDGTALVINPSSTFTTTVQLPAPASRIELYTGPKPSDSTPAQRALLYDPGSDKVTFLDLAGFGTDQNRNGKPELLGVPQSYVKLVPLTEDKVLLLHQDSGLSLLNLSDRSLSPITGPNVVDAVPDLDLQKLWLAPPGDRLGYLDLTDYHPNEVRLDATIEHFVRVPQSNKNRQPKVVATHPSSVGYMTVLDAKNPTNLDHAYGVSGYLFEGVLGGNP